VDEDKTELYLIRHGESVPNVTPIIGGMKGDAGLTDRGREQARLLEKRLREEELHVDQLYASTLPRALETAEYVARALDLPIQPDEELHELRPGEADGLTVDEWRERYRPHPPGVRDAFTPFAPGGESWVSFLARAGAAIVRLVDRHPGQTVVAVCHGGVIEASFYLAFGLGGSTDRVSFAVLNTSITRWRHQRGPDGRRKWRAVTLNDAGHLAGADTPTESPREAVPTPPEEAAEQDHSLDHAGAAQRPR
jgi:probable phosphoglycerate mutase